MTESSAFSGSAPGCGVLNQDFLKSTAHAPGVYLMKDDRGRVIYVGKARDLRKRLASYARIPDTATSKTAVMVAKVGSVATIITRTEKEALILEAALIKKHRPRYNILLRDDKNYPYIKVTVNETWPRLVMTRRRQRDGSRYFGPFSSAAAMWETLHYLNSLFPLRRCKGKELKKRSRPCLNQQMQRCLAPCCDHVEAEKYRQLVKGVLMVLEGRDRELVRDLEVKMKSAVAALDFEEAALCRDRIRALRKTLEKQVMVAGHFRDQDVFGFHRQEEAVSISVVSVRNGQVSGHRSFYLAEPVGDDPGILAELLRRYYGAGRPVVAEILLPFAPVEEESLCEWLGDLRSGRVVCRVPKRGDQLKLVGIARTNAEKSFAELKAKAHGWATTAGIMAGSLRLKRPPDRVECLDISNLGGEQAVGALVSFVDGRKNTPGFRHYKIRTVAGPDDYGMMAEVLRRRFGKGASPAERPDLLVLDGGKGQLNMAGKILAELGLEQDIELVAIAKNRDRSGGRDRLFRPGRKNPLLLPGHAPVLLFLMRVRDEAHRYGITFHRRWRRRDTLGSELDRLAGIGPARKRALLIRFGSLDKVKQATVEELAATPGVGPQLARQVRDFFRLDERAVSG
ncbi:MAG: excinuclease ABC subunit UvrC [Desulfobacterales bacterium]|nr:excinuclease ABC subunit UvrC [Desulfobacterales bacterium]